MIASLSEFLRLDRSLTPILIAQGRHLEFVERRVTIVQKYKIRAISDFRRRKTGFRGVSISSLWLPKIVTIRSHSCYLCYSVIENFGRGQRYFLSYLQSGDSRSQDIGCWWKLLIDSAGRKTPSTTSSPRLQRCWYRKRGVGGAY